jgi:uncharacterized protein (DUF1697 family)
MRYVALLRAINVSGQKIIKMEDLRRIMDMPGIKNISTFIQSGNVLFDSAENDTEKLRIKIEKKLHKDLGYEVETFVRSAGEMASVLKNNPFAQTESAHKTAVYVCFLSGTPAREKIKDIEALSFDMEQYRVIGSELYCWMIKDVERKEVFTNKIMEKKLGLTATSRNITSVTKLVALLNG